MTVQETTLSRRRDGRALDRGAGPTAPQQPAEKPVRRLPVQKDWPTWAIIAAQIGILVGALALWEIGARTGWIDAFFWSQPSAIGETLMIFFTSGDAWTDISFTFRSTIFGLPARHHGRIAARPLVLVVAQLRGHRAALHHLPGVDPKTRAGAADHPGVRHRARLQGRGCDGADAGGLDADHLCRREGARSRQREAVLFARRHRAWQVFSKLVVPFCLPWIISVLRVNIGLALDRRDRRRVHRLPARPRPRDPLCRADLRDRAGLGGGAGALDAWRSSCTWRCRGSKACCARACGNDVEFKTRTARIVMNRRKFLQSTATLGTGLGLALAAPPCIARAASKELLVAEPVHSTGYLPMYIAMAKGYFAESDIVVKIVTIETGGRPHQRGAFRPGFRLHRRARAQRLRQSEGRGAARDRALRRPRQRLSLRRQGPRAQGQGLAELFQGQVDSGRRLIAARRTRSCAICWPNGNSIAKRDVTLIESAELGRACRRAGRPGQ